MLQPKNMIAAIDFSESSLLAMETALGLAPDQGGKLCLLHVLEVPRGIDPMGVLQPSIEELEAEALGRLQELVPDNPEKDIQIERLVVRGSPAKVIAAQAKERAADLIVVGTHGRTGLARMLLGSTAEAILRSTPCKVLVVKA
jgi:nucleotide-binding universal stress UspA family protein